MEYYFYKLKNGIRLIHKHEISEIAYFEWMINTGARDEQPEENGIAHFIEHTIFKGTKKRNVFKVINRIEEVGGELNAFTTKEETCVYSIFPKKYYERSIELIADIIFNSAFPEKELTKEKEVVIDEINSYQDNPADLIFEEFDRLLHPSHPIGYDIMGTPETVKSFNKDKILSFIERNYQTDQMVLCSIGNIDFKKLIDLVEIFFGTHPERIREWTRRQVTDYEKFSVDQKRDTHQNHCILGRTVLFPSENQKSGLLFLSNYLGGQGMNSKLNLSLREKNGLSYNVESNFTSYVDAGTFNIYFGTDKKNLKKSLKIVKEELNKLRVKKISEPDFNKAKRQLKGQIAILMENKESLLYNLGKCVLINKNFDILAESYKQIDSLNTQILWDVANEILDTEHLSFLVYK
jgi:predicted Zn-dependent peptidase